MSYGVTVALTVISSSSHTVGWGELEPVLRDCTPAWGEVATGVPARLIEEAARLYGRGSFAAVAGTITPTPAAWWKCHACMRTLARRHR